MMLCRNTEVEVHSLDAETDYFDIVARILQRDTLAPYLSIICLDRVLQTSIDLKKKKKKKENSFTQKKAKCRRYPAESITDTYYAGDIALLGNTPTQFESIDWRRQQEALASKMEYICFNPEEIISTRKLIDKLIYFGSSISPSESHVNIRLAKA